MSPIFLLQFGKALCGESPVRSAASGLAYACFVLILFLFVPSQTAHSQSGQDSNSSTVAPTSRPRTVGTNATDSATAPAASVETGRQIAETVGEDDVVRVDSNLVLVPASVVDGRGRAITDLKLEDFELRIDGEVKSLSDLSRAETPVLIALLFDNSASLSAARAFEKQAATRFFQTVVRKIDRAAIYSISTVPTLSQPLTSNLTRLVNTIEGFPQPEGATALFDTIAQAADYLRPFTGRKVIVLVSDGTDTVSDMAFDEALNRVLRSDSQVYVIQTRQVEDPDLHDPVSEGLIAKLTEQTGGAVYAPRAVEDLDAAFSQIALDIGQQYLLSYYPQEERQDKYFRFINLRVKTRPNLRVRARKGFYPTAAKASSATGSRPPNDRRNVGSEFFVSMPTNSVPTDAMRPASDGIVVSRQASNEGVSRKIGPDGPDDDVTTSKRPVNLAPSIPENAVTTAQNPAHQAKSKHVDVAELPARLTPAPTTSTARTVTRSSDANREVPKNQPGPTPERRGAEVKAPVSGGVLNGKALSLPTPVYPHSARSAGAWGTVVVEVSIDFTGTVRRARAVSGHPLLQKAAVLAALQAKFSPTLLSGQPIGVEGTLRYEFKSP